MDVDSEHADSLNLEMLDASLNRLNSLVVLVSFLAGEVTKFAIFFLDCNWAGPSDPSPLLEDRKDFALQRHVDAFPRADLIVPSGGPALAIAFTDALLISTLDVANTFEETLPFGTEEQPDRIIGYAAEPPILNGGEISLKASMLLCTSHSGVVLVDYDLDKVTEDVPIQMEEPWVVLKRLTRSMSLVLLNRRSHIIVPTKSSRTFPTIAKNVHRRACEIKSSKPFSLPRKG